MNLPNIDKRLRWFFWGCALLVARMLLPAQVIETVYSRGIFFIFRWIWDYTLGWSPLTLLYLFFIILTIYCFISLRLYIIKAKKLPWKGRFKELFLSLGGFFGIMATWFMLSWGFNYGRVPLEQQMQLEPSALDSVALCEEAAYITQLCDSLRRLVPDADTVALGETIPEPSLIEDIARKQLIKVLLDFGYPTPGMPRCRYLPPFTLRRISIAGIYWPFTAEGHVDSGMHPLEMAYSTAHELSHAYGLSREDECNFMALMACLRSDDPLIQYSGALEHWRLVMGELRDVAPAAYQYFRPSIPLGMKKDLISIFALRDIKPEIFPRVSEGVNNLYLKALGVNEGVLSYDLAIQLARSYRLKTGTLITR